MEHRWGERTIVQSPARVRLPGGDFEDCVLSDISTSGAFLETDPGFRLLMPVEVELPDLTVACGFVVRCTTRGIGIEWDELVRPIERPKTGLWPGALLPQLRGPMSTRVP